jgi:hypothetical protein
MHPVVDRHPSPRTPSNLVGRSDLAAALVSIALAGALAAPALAGNCDHRGERTESLDAVGVARVEIDARAGRLEVEGREGASRIEARGEICASSEDLLREIELRARRSGDVLHLEVVIPDGKGWRSQGSMDLSVELPADLEVEIDDGSGDMVVRGATVGRVDDGSGDLRFEDTRGRLELDDGSGNIRIVRHEGSIELDDGSGDVEIRDVRGDVRVDDDGSGNLRFEDVTGSVRVDDDGSGDIVARSIGGDFVVGDGGSGSIRHRNVAGRVDVPTDD